MADAVADASGRLHRSLVSVRNPDGGWGYVAGKASRLEPTCWALLAGLENNTEPPERVIVTLSLLAAWQRASGLLGDISAAAPNLAFNGLAALVVRRMCVRRPPGLPDLYGLEARLLKGLVATKGVATDINDIQRQNNHLQGWPWIGETSSWVEPTAFCLLAMKKARQVFPDARIDARVADADRVLDDRCCLAGGWN